MQDAAIASIVLGVPLLIAGIFEIWRGLETMNWRPERGEVVDSFVEESEAVTDDPGSQYYKNKLFATAWLPRVIYKYSIQGREYEGNTINRRHMHSILKFQARWRASRYEAGQDVKVFVSPRDPRQAVLTRGACVADYVVFVLGVTLLMLAKVLG